MHEEICIFCISRVIIPEALEFSGGMCKIVFLQNPESKELIHWLHHVEVLHVFGLVQPKGIKSFIIFMFELGIFC